MLRKWFRKWSGLKDIDDTLEDIDTRLQNINYGINYTRDDVNSNNQYIRVTLLALGRVLAQDKAYTQSEFSPERKAESDRLGEEVIQRLLGEDSARQPGTGELE